MVDFDKFKEVLIEVIGHRFCIDDGIEFIVKHPTIPEKNLFSIQNNEFKSQFEDIVAKQVNGIEYVTNTTYEVAIDGDLYARRRIEDIHRGS